MYNWWPHRISQNLPALLGDARHSAAARIDEQGGASTARRLSVGDRCFLSEALVTGPAFKSEHGPDGDSISLATKFRRVARYGRNARRRLDSRPKTNANESQRRPRHAGP